MLKKSPSLSLILFLILLIINIIIFSKLLVIDSNEIESNETYLFKKCNEKNDFDSSSMSFHSYIKNKAFENPSSLENYYTSVKKSDITNETLLNTLCSYSTDSLMKYEFDSLTYNPNVLEGLIFWVEEFNYYKRNDTASFSII